MGKRKKRRKRRRAEERAEQARLGEMAGDSDEEEYEDAELNRLLAVLVLDVFANRNLINLNMMTNRGGRKKKTLS
ncbi:MAG: hypothetical protein Q9P01_17590 [Anaerolineae bacterium]|nr:hypothetical protein [Anaerolineae bacterium]